MEAVQLLKKDLIPEAAEAIKGSDPAIQNIAKELATAIKSDGIQMLLKGITQKYFNVQPPAARQAITPDAKIQIFVNGLKYLFDVLGEDKTLREGLEYIPKELDKFKEVL